MDPIELQRQIRNNSSDLQDFCKDLSNWGEEMKRKDEELKQSASFESQAPLPRKLKKSKSSEENHSETSKQNAIKGLDYAAWDKFDVEAECAKVDSEKKVESDDSGELTDEFDESIRDEAVLEKEKGNKFVKTQRWDQAIACYTKAITCYAYDPIFYANRALCYLKKGELSKAETDCTAALQLDKTYVKAYQRRAAAREGLNQLQEAHSDLLKVFDYEPNNKESKNVLARIEKKMESAIKKPSTTDCQRPVSKFTISRQQQKEKSALKEQTESSTQSVTPNIQGTPRDLDLPVIPNIPHKYTTRSPDITIIENSKADVKINQRNMQGMPRNLEYWPSGSDVKIIQPVTKPPHLQSAKPLKRISIKDIEILTNDILNETPPAVPSNPIKTCSEAQNKPGKLKIKEIEALPLPNPLKNNLVINCDDFKIVERKPPVSAKKLVQDITDEQEKVSKDREKKYKEIINQKILKENVDETSFMHCTPKTAVQFNCDWRAIRHNSEYKFRYLQQINPCTLPNIFKESLESEIFSEIIKTLAESFVEKNVPVYDYLLWFTQVKRFSMLTMFLTTEDKRNVLKLVDYLRNDNGTPPENISSLIKKYEL